jgi:hypothetical protein
MTRLAFYPNHYQERICNASSMPGGVPGESTAPVATYFPQLKEKEPYFLKCVELAERYRDTPLIIVGDLNTGRNDLDLETGGPAAILAC